MTKTILTTCCLLICLAFIRCHKDDDPKPACKITTLSSSDGSEDYNFTYNSDGKLSGSSSSTYTDTYTYSGSTITVVSAENGQFSYKDIATINGSGLATNVRTEFNAAGTSWYNVAYEYNGTEVVKETATTSAGDAPVVTTYTWENGNVVSSLSDGETTTFTYYTDKSSKDGDYLHLLTLTQGYEIFRTKNMLKSIISDSETANIAYTFDTDGKVTAITINEDGDTQTLSYQYQCN